MTTASGAGSAKLKSSSRARKGSDTETLFAVRGIYERLDIGAPVGAAIATARSFEFADDFRASVEGWIQTDLPILGVLRDASARAIYKLTPEKDVADASLYGIMLGGEVLRQVVGHDITPLRTVSANIAGQRNHYGFLHVESGLYYDGNPPTAEEMAEVFGDIAATEFAKIKRPEILSMAAAITLLGLKEPR